MRIHGMMALAAACGMLLGGYAKADGSSAAELADLKAKVAALESRTMAPASASGAGDASALTAMRTDKARVQFGGDFEVAASSMRRTTKNNYSDKINQQQFKTNDADLNMKVTTLSPDTYLFVKLDLDDFYTSNSGSGDTNTVGQGNDLLEEVYYTWKNIRGSAFDVQFGKKEVPFGMDVKTLISDAYTHNNGTGSFLGSAVTTDNTSSGNPTSSWSKTSSSDLAAKYRAGTIDTAGAAVASGADTAAQAAANKAYAAKYVQNGNDHGAVGFTPFSHPGEIDNAYAFQTNWHYKELLTLEASVFQNNEADATANNLRGTSEDESEDNLLLNSYTFRAILKPISDLKIQASISNQHMSSKDDDSNNYWIYNVMNDGTVTGTNYGGENGSDNKQAASFGVDYDPKKGPIRAYTEYIHGWNQNYCTEVTTDTIQVGAVWHAIEKKLDLCVDANWLGINNDLVTGDENYFKIACGPKYYTESGIWFALEYAHEWYSCTIDNYEDASADVVSFCTGWSF